MAEWADKNALSLIILMHDSSDVAELGPKCPLVAKVG
jgi:hypothetical protein